MPQRPHNREAVECIRGHPLAGDNLRLVPARGRACYRRCRACDREREKVRQRSSARAGDKEAQLPNGHDKRYTSRLRGGWEEFGNDTAPEPEPCDCCGARVRRGHYHREEDRWLCLGCWDEQIAPTVPQKQQRKTYHSGDY